MERCTEAHQGNCQLSNTTGNYQSKASNAIGVVYKCPLYMVDVWNLWSFKCVLDLQILNKNPCLKEYFMQNGNYELRMKNEYLVYLDYIIKFQKKIVSDSAFNSLIQSTYLKSYFKCMPSNLQRSATAVITRPHNMLLDQQQQLQVYDIRTWIEGFIDVQHLQVLDSGYRITLVDKNITAALVHSIYIGDY